MDNRRPYVLAVAIAMFAAIFAARFAIGDVDVDDPIMLLLVFPIALLAIEFGVVAGVASGIAGFVLFAAWVEIEQPAEGPTVVDYLVRGSVFILLGASLGVASDRLNAARRRAESIAHSSGEAFVSMDQAGRITDWNPAAGRTFGWRREEVLGKPLVEVLITKDLRPKFERSLQRFLETGKEEALPQRREARALHRSGRELPVEVSISPAWIDREWVFHSFIRDISERDQLLAKIREVAHTDELTGIANRRAFDDALRREIAGARRTGEPLCIAVVDIDHFKAFNDEHGHLAGNLVLRQATDAWAGALRAEDLLARFGGEEFLCLFRRCGLAEALPVIERLRAATPGGVTVSAGLAAWEPGESPEELFGRTDTALYEAKRTGRNRTIVATKAGEPAQ